MAERPLDCGECKKSIAVQYTELEGEKLSRTIMCADCPHLEKQLYGTTAHSSSCKGPVLQGSMTCGTCNTSLEAIRMGHQLGCRECYDVFSEIIVDELIKEERVSRHFSGNPRTQPIHMGRTPGEVSEISATLRLIALNEALDETLIREDYEQAALLRDQIEKLKATKKDEELKG